MICQSMSAGIQTLVHGMHDPSLISTRRPRVAPPTQTSLLIEATAMNWACPGASCRERCVLSEGLGCIGVWPRAMFPRPEFRAS